MSNTVITNYTDLNGPSSKADSSVVVIVNKDGSLSVDEKLLGTLMGTDGSQGAISVVRVGHEGRPDDATDSDSDDDKVPHVTLSVDSYYDEPNSIIKYDSGAEMLQSLRIETRENSLLGFQNDHCYTPLTSPNTLTSHRSDSYAGYDEPILEIKPQSPPKAIPTSKKITILEQKIIPKGKKLLINTSDAVLIKGNEILNKGLPSKSKLSAEKKHRSEESSESSSISSSGDSIPDRDSDSDYKDVKDKSGSVKKSKLKPRILKAQTAKASKLEPKIFSRVKANKNVVKREIKEKLLNKSIESQLREFDQPKPKSQPESIEVSATGSKNVKQTTKSAKKEKRNPAHMNALLSDMTSLFSNPDVIRRVSTDNKMVTTKDSAPGIEARKSVEGKDKLKNVNQKGIRQKAVLVADKSTKGYDLIPQIDDASLAQILQDTTGISTVPTKSQPAITTSNAMNSPSLAGPLSPTLDLLGGLQPEEEGLTEDLLMHVAQLVESSENLQEVIDKQVLGKVDSLPNKAPVNSPFQQAQNVANLYNTTPLKSAKSLLPINKNPIEIVRRDGRVITLPPIEAPATRSSKRKSQLETVSSPPDVLSTPPPSVVQPIVALAEVLPVQQVAKQLVSKKVLPKKLETEEADVVEKAPAESQESWNSEDDPYRLWCICRQPHNNRFMICCDGCEDWFHGKCVNITKAMGQQMEEQGIEWRCPNCVKKTKTPKTIPKAVIVQKKRESDEGSGTPRRPSGDLKSLASKSSCIVCKKSARASSIYCSDACILKHAQDSLATSPTKTEEPGKGQNKIKIETSRVIVFERKTGRCLAGPNAPTAENLKAWLQRNPTFEVVRPGTLSTIRPKQPMKKPSAEPQKVQSTLNFERIPKKVPAQPLPVKVGQQDPREGSSKMGTSSREEGARAVKLAQQDPREGSLKMGTSNREEGARAVKVAQQDPREGSSKIGTSGREEGARAVKVAQQDPREGSSKMGTPSREEGARATGHARTPAPGMPRAPHSSEGVDTPRPSTSAARPGPSSELKKPQRTPASRSQSNLDKLSVSPVARRKDSVTPDNKNKMSIAPIRENVRKALQEQMGIRMKENTGPKFTEQEIKKFAIETEAELHELFRDVGVKYKAKYRSLMFNIKDRKNLSLWQKICDKTISPKQLVRLSPEELASQELAQWRDKEAKHQLELIKKSELDLLAASKTYVLKTHKGEEVMDAKQSVSTELDPNVPIEDVVTALNDSAVDEAALAENFQETGIAVRKLSVDSGDKYGSRKRGKEESETHSKKSKKDTKRNLDDRRSSRSSRKRSDSKPKEEKPRRSERRSSRLRTPSKERKVETKEKETAERRRRSGSKGKSKKRSKSREHSRSKSRVRERSKSRTRERSKSRTRERSESRGRSKRRSRSRDKRRRNKSRSKHRPDDDNVVHRSRSQENISSKSKNDSTDSDSVERPKSAMMKEAHPEYDPHEPMITSAFSEEDLRKSREDIYEDSFKEDVVEFPNVDLDSSKSFSLGTDIVLPKYSRRRDKASEVESDQEPSSTVDNSAATIWNGCINMVDVARFYVAAHEVSGISADLEEDLSAELDIVGRINPETVWDYIGKMKRTGNKDIVVLRLQAANDEEKMQYIALYSYLSSRNRLGVVKVSNTTTVKDFYILPLPANSPLPAVLLPLEGPGLDEVKNHLLIAIVVRQRKKRPAPNIPKDIIPAKVARGARKRSYTPPAVAGSSMLLAGLPQPPYSSPALSTSVKDKIAASLAAADDDEAYSPGSSSNESPSRPSAPAPPGVAPPGDILRTKMEELNRQIEEQKQQIRKMAQADSSVAGEEEAYSPSRPMTPSPPPAPVPLSDIALPSNLQEILATIKQRSETSTADVDMRMKP